MCEYDSDELEYWVNVRTTGTLAREDLETLTRTRVHEGEAPADTMGTGAFETFGKGDAPLEGDATMNESHLHYLHYTCQLHSVCKDSQPIPCAHDTYNSLDRIVST